MKITVIGTGYVGLVTGACLADVGIEVSCVDIDQKKIDGLKNGILPIYEPGLKDIVLRNFENGRLHFTTDLSEGIKGSSAAFIAVSKHTSWSCCSKPTDFKVSEATPKT